VRELMKGKEKFRESEWLTEKVKMEGVLFIDRG
jgi:hypothetical protein